MDNTVSKINEAVAAYFEANPKTEWIPAKEMMPDLIKMGLFSKDVKKGLPLRKVLRFLEKEGRILQKSLLMK